MSDQIQEIKLLKKKLLKRKPSRLFPQISDGDKAYLQSQLCRQPDDTNETLKSRRLGYIKSCGIRFREQLLWIGAWGYSDVSIYSKED